MQRRIEAVFSNLFYLFFCGQILSPSIAGVTVYLENFIALANPFFLSWFIGRFGNAQTLALLLVAITVAMAGADYVLVPKIFAFAISLAYISYSRERGVFYLFRYIALSATLAMLQFVFIFIDPAIAFKLGPTSISQAIWGSHATGTFTNFYTIFAFARVSGLSREGGFFATLVVNCLLLYAIDRRLTGYRNGWVVLALTVAFILSFSKMSLLLVPAYLIIRYRTWIDRIPYPLVPVLFILPMIWLWTHEIGFLLEDDNATYLQRFGGFVALPDLDARQLLFGTGHLSHVHSYVAQESLSMPYDAFDYYTGLPGSIMEQGLIVTGLILGVLWLLGISSAGLLVLLVLTMNVDFTTSQNFVTLSYFIALTYMSRGPVRLIRRFESPSVRA